MLSFTRARDFADLVSVSSLCCPPLTYAHTYTRPSLSQTLSPSRALDLHRHCLSPQDSPYIFHPHESILISLCLISPAPFHSVLYFHPNTLPLLHPLSRSLTLLLNSSSRIPSYSSQNPAFLPLTMDTLREFVRLPSHKSALKGCCRL